METSLPTVPREPAHQAAALVPETLGPTFDEADMMDTASPGLLAGGFGALRSCHCFERRPFYGQKPQRSRFVAFRGVAGAAVWFWDELRLGDGLRRPGLSTGAEPNLQRLYKHCFDSNPMRPLVLCGGAGVLLAATGRVKWRKCRTDPELVKKKGSRGRGRNPLQQCSFASGNGAEV